MAKKDKYIYHFGNGKAQGKKTMKDLLGGKGANLAEMTNNNVPVPPGFTITTTMCNIFHKNKCRFPKTFKEELEKAIKNLEKVTKKSFGDLKNPLLVSVRSGARISMPGMMDTVLNLGLNDKTVLALAEKSKNERFAYDSYRRFLTMFGDVVLEIKREHFEKALQAKKDKLKVSFDYELTTEALKELVEEYKIIIKSKSGKPFPQKIQTQLDLTIKAVFNSWQNKRAITYRELNNIPHDIGTAVNVQTMVFGNFSENSATGVGFTRNPSTGKKEFYGEYLINAQGEDVVAGIRTPKEIIELKKDMPQAFKQLKDVTTKLEQDYKDMQDFEFTIEEGILYMLQTRTGKRSAKSAIKIAIDMIKEGLITEEEAILRITPEQVNNLLHPIIDPSAKFDILTKGLPGAPGAAVGQIVFDPDLAVSLKEQGKDVILVRPETSPDDINGINAANGILTARGGMTSHAAVVARGMGKCCVVGCEEIKIKNNSFKVNNIEISENDWITIDGNTGNVILGKIETIAPTTSNEFKKFLNLTEKYTKLQVRANADNPTDAKAAKDFGAKGIGLCRTEHMFFKKDRLPFMQEMILANTKEERIKALNKLIKFQTEDFYTLFKTMKNLPVTIRTLDPPLHEFLPKTEEEAKELSNKINISVNDILNKTKELHEVNPMLGHRGCRLSITYPEILEMQIKAITLAALKAKKSKISVTPEIMIPLVGNVNEFINQKAIVISTINQILKEKKSKLNYKIGTMIEIPRAALTADKIAEHADFFSFGTNDLTQMGMGFSRDDAGKFIKIYQDLGIFKNDPFQTLDQEGIGELVKIGIEKGRSSKKDLKVGICGEHGGDPESVKFCHLNNFTYVSCSPYRVPIAKLAASQIFLTTKPIKKTTKKK